MVNCKELSQAGFKYIGTPYSQMDCQAFVERCLKDCGDSTNLGGSNSWFRECMKNGWTGTPEQCREQFGEIPYGAFLFIRSEVSDKTPEKFRHDGVGDITHMGLVTWTGKGALHSSSSKGCVCESDFKGKTIPNGGWNRIGLWNHVDYGKQMDPQEDEPMEKATVHSDNGQPVKMRQKPSTNCKYYEEVPNGTIVDLLESGEDWCKIQYNGKTGYMMSDFLIRGEIIPGDDGYTDEMVMVRRADLLAIYNAIGEMLKVVG